MNSFIDNLSLIIVVTVLLDKVASGNTIGLYEKSEHLKLQKFDGATNTEDINIVGKSLIRRRRMVDANVAQPGHFPHIISVQTCNNASLEQCEHKCTGSIINESWILTTALCINGIDLIKHHVVIKAGRYDLEQQESTEQISLIHSYYMRSDFGLDKNAMIKNDIGLIKLKTPLNFTDRVAAIRLPTTNETRSDIKNNVTLLSWGYKDEPNYNLDTSRALKFFNMVNLDEKECAKEMRKLIMAIRVVNENELKESLDTKICTKESINIYVDNSGGLLVDKNENDQSEVIGIASFTSKAETKNATIVYTKLSSYMEWITNIMSLILDEEIVKNCAINAFKERQSSLAVQNDDFSYVTKIDCQKNESLNSQA